ncbi:hypothetical protein SD37_40300 [Amycolatopsis orientalis]|uniref:Uncharacterized protein n=1 Tax=Amycolatopsis orientalis TaxID=31958 RepID=A0A193C9Q8_AMYOR|nr:hypothetical protein [Amycolatopsis orientalis]ANN21217.1 hypothetical protein SD37_40300 [Amycolatopsis orientalis]
MAALQLPSQLRDQILYTMYSKAEELDWELLSNGKKTEQYRQWVDDDEVGQVMLRHGAEKDVRVWLKDVAMKEYARAQEGIGSYVRYLPNRFKGTQEIVNAALDPSWIVKPDSVVIKPNRCTAIKDASSRLVVWGRPSSFKDLFWAALTATKGGGDEAVIVVTTRDGENISDADKLMQKEIGVRGDFEVVHLNRQMIPNPDYVPLSA